MPGRRAPPIPEPPWIACHRSSTASRDEFVPYLDPVSSAIHGLHGMSSALSLKLDPVSSAIHGLHGISSVLSLKLDPVSSAIHGLHGMSSS